MAILSKSTKGEKPTGRHETLDLGKFTKDKTGELTKIVTPGGPDWAFIPNELPPKWEFPTRLWPLLSAAQEKLGRLDEKGKTVTSPSLLLTPLQQREALRSSSLEGTYATPQDLLIYEGNLSKKNDNATEREVANYNASLLYGFHKLKDETTSGLPLSLRLICEMHGILLKGVRGDDSDCGRFRDRQVHVGFDRRYVPPPAGDPLRKCLDNFERSIHEHNDEYPPLVRAYLMHYQFEAIHPFMDGNGRVGRSLLSLMIYKWSGLSLPWLYMSAFFEKYKDDYIDRLFKVSTHGAWDEWIEFCLTGTVAQCTDALVRCDKLDSLRKYAHSIADALSPRMNRIIDRAFHAPVFTASEVASYCSTSAPTARADIDKLIEVGFVKHLQGEHPKIFYAPQIFGIAYSEKDFGESQVSGEGPQEGGA